MYGFGWGSVQNDLVTALALANSALQTALISRLREAGLISSPDVSMIGL